MRAAVAIRPESAHAMMNLGNGHCFLDRNDEAIACFRKANELQPGSSSIYANLGEALLRKGSYDEAIDAFEKAIRLKLEPDVYAALSMVYSNRPDVDRRNPRLAVELANQAIQGEPRFGNCWTALGAAQYREGKWQDARNAFEQALQLDMSGCCGGTFRWDDAINQFFLAMCCHQLAEPDQARKHYERGVQSMKALKPRGEDVGQLRRIRAETEELLKITTETKPD
jgi:tetratricopeptide (TPR) repeat protein